MSSDWSQLPARLTFRQARSLLDAYEWNEQRFMDQCTIPASAYFEWRASVVLKLLRDGKPVDRMAALTDLAVLAAGTLVIAVAAATPGGANIKKSPSPGQRCRAMSKTRPSCSDTSR